MGIAVVSKAEYKNKSAGEKECFVYHVTIDDIRILKITQQYVFLIRNYGILLKLD